MSDDRVFVKTSRFECRNTRPPNHKHRENYSGVLPSSFLRYISDNTPNHKKAPPATYRKFYRTRTKQSSLEVRTKSQMESLRYTYARGQYIVHQNGKHLRKSDGPEHAVSSVQIERQHTEAEQPSHRVTICGISARCREVRTKAQHNNQSPASRCHSPSTSSTQMSRGRCVDTTREQQCLIL